MEEKRIESFKEFAKYLEYPMVVFEAESGKAVDVNYEAEVLLGGQVETLRLEPGRAMGIIDFWEKLHDEKTVMWHRMQLFADEREYAINGLVSELVLEDKTLYSLMFELQTDTSFGGLILERFLVQDQTVAVRLERDTEEEFRIEYISKNINSYGYTREQFYDGAVTLMDLICPEDEEWAYENMEDAAKAGKEELMFSCRIFTESQELIPVRFNIRYMYNDYGRLTNVEMLIADSREEYKRNSENMHLNRAISKMKNVVLVKSYRAGKRSLDYISPNAGILGMNVDALLNGYRLTEDYIHPSDRDMVIDTIYQAVANGVTDYTQSYRMVRDDGRQMWVLNEVTITRISDGEAEISFLLTDVTEQKEMELNLTKQDEYMPEERVKREEPTPVTINGNDKEALDAIQLMVDTLSQNADYYTVVLNAEGGLLTSPAGPVGEIGQFYDLFERPEFKEEFIAASGRAGQQVTPQSMNFSTEQFTAYMVLAPVVLNDAVIAYWVLASFSADSAQRLNILIGQQWQLVNSITSCFCAQQQIRQEQKFRKLAELQIDKERRGKQMIRDILECMVKKSEAGLGEACQKLGSFLSLANIGLYRENKNNQKSEIYYAWDCAGEETAFFETLSSMVSEYAVLQERMGKNGYVMIDRAMSDPFLQEILQKTGMGTILMRPISMGSGERGYIVFAAADRTRKFEERDIGFMEMISLALECMLMGNREMVKGRDLKDNLLEAYDYIRDAVFVKNNETGEIIFANKAMDKLFGYNLVGMPANQVINDQLEHYREIGGVRKRFIANKKVTKWQRYMKELDQIMNIVEIHMELMNNTDCSLYILKKNKQKNKG